MAGLAIANVPKCAILSTPPHWKGHSMPRHTLKVQSLTRRLSQSLGSLRRDLLALAILVGTASASGPGPSGRLPRRRRRHLTPADRARLRVQGEYLGLVRHLSAKDRTRVKAVRAKSGYGAAIKMARRLTRGWIGAQFSSLISARAFRR